MARHFFFSLRARLQGTTLLSGVVKVVALEQVLKLTGCGRRDRKPRLGVRFALFRRLASNNLHRSRRFRSVGLKHKADFASEYSSLENVLFAGEVAPQDVNVIQIDHPRIVLLCNNCTKDLAGQESSELCRGRLPLLYRHGNLRRLSKLLRRTPGSAKLTTWSHANINSSARLSFLWTPPAKLS